MNANSCPVPSYPAVPQVSGQLGFSLPSEVEPGVDERGLRRATTRSLDYEFERQFELRTCPVRDWSVADSPPLDLLTMGFESLDLSGDERLQAMLGDLRTAGEIDQSQAHALRRRLTGQVFKLSSGKRLKLLHVADEGLIMRKGGPNGLKPDPDAQMNGMNDHDVAMAVHGDQDVFGTPLKQIMRGFAPRLFRHQSPDRRNLLSPLVLVNLWIPLQQVTRPLTLMDRRTLDAPRQQLRYALPTDSFLERRQDMRFNDVWAFLHDDAHQWYYRADMGHEQAYVFDTLGEPHGSFMLPGEAVAEMYFKLLREQLAQLAGGSVTAQAPSAVPVLPADTPAPLRGAIDAMAAVASAAPGDASDASHANVQAWASAAHEAMDAVVRKSLEMRVVAVLLPDMWPFNRRPAH